MFASPSVAYWLMPIAREGDSLFKKLLKKLFSQSLVNLNEWVSQN